jgi:hypothetical protein
MVMLGVHLQGVNPKSFRDKDVERPFRNILERGIPVVLFMPPKLIDTWPDRIVDLAKEVVSREGSVLGQYGNKCECSHKHTFVDRHHEFACLYNVSMSYEEQTKRMDEGKERLTGLVGVEPEAFCAPNNLFDDVTLCAAKDKGYKWFADQARIGIKPYSLGKMIVIPQANLDRRIPEGVRGVYVHYDRIDRNSKAYEAALNRVCSVTEIKPEEVSDRMIERNKRRKHWGKFLRDVVRLQRNYKSNLLARKI